MVGPCGLEKAMFGDTKVRIIRRMGSGVWSREVQRRIEKEQHGNSELPEWIAPDGGRAG